MLLDDPTAGNPSGDLLVGEVACLYQSIACYEEEQRDSQEGSHDGARERLSGKVELEEPSQEVEVHRNQLTQNFFCDLTSHRKGRRKLEGGALPVLGLELTNPLRRN